MHKQEIVTFLIQVQTYVEKKIDITSERQLYRKLDGYWRRVDRPKTLAATPKLFGRSIAEMRLLE